MQCIDIQSEEKKNPQLNKSTNFGDDVLTKQESIVLRNCCLKLNHYSMMMMFEKFLCYSFLLMFFSCALL